jgi:hypothetical protein
MKGGVFMNKAQCVAKYAKLLRKDKLKGYLLAICGGIITGLMYKVGVSAGVNATCQELAEAMPEDAYFGEEADKKDAN